MALDIPVHSNTEYVNTVLAIVGTITGLFGVWIVGITNGVIWQKWRSRDESLAAAFKILKESLLGIQLLESSSKLKDDYIGDDRIKIPYKIKSDVEVREGIWLGASIQFGDYGTPSWKMFNRIDQDEEIVLRKGTHEYERVLTVSLDAAGLGVCYLVWDVWFGVVGSSEKSIRLKEAGRKRIRVR